MAPSRTKFEKSFLGKNGIRQNESRLIAWKMAQANLQGQWCLAQLVIHQVRLKPQLCAETEFSSVWQQSSKGEQHMGAHKDREDVAARCRTKRKGSWWGENGTMLKEKPIEFLGENGPALDIEPAKLLREKWHRAGQNHRGVFG
ncbi:hypothetical protein T11_17176 [Trichinella zimbabwensis]|uniref:Uncharacterized protein n=1 Tax=Trichinella zimbabwensis TaxID=268475 RepID=A0A0V1GTW3_9BILA|nr:hypothetical protein T11_17176 [Trichinella zimbabwensis]